MIELLSGVSPVWHYLEQANALEISMKDMRHILASDWCVSRSITRFPFALSPCQERHGHGVDALHVQQRGDVILSISCLLVSHLNR